MVQVVLPVKYSPARELRPLPLCLPCSADRKETTQPHYWRCNNTGSCNTMTTTTTTTIGRPWLFLVSLILMTWNGTSNVLTLDKASPIVFVTAFHPMESSTIHVPSSLSMLSSTTNSHSHSNNNSNNNSNTIVCYRRFRSDCFGQRTGGMNRSDEEGYNNNNKNSLSSSDREKRDEERRRKQRKEDVVIGKTSAQRGAQDYVLNPDATEAEYLRSASQVEQLVYQYTEEGLNAMKALRLDQADAAFAEVFRCKADAYVWQAGIVKFYLGADYFGAADIFARNALYYERKFGPMGVGPATEERIWRDATELKYMHGLKKKERARYVLERTQFLTQGSRAKATSTSTTTTSTPMTTNVIPQIQETNNDDNEKDEDEDGTRILVETRKVLKLVHELFDASLQQNVASEALSRAQLLSIAGDAAELQQLQQKVRFDRKKWKLTAWYYLGLYYDVIGNIDESKRCIKIAFQLAGLTAGKASDIMATLPLLHMTARDWFDDDPYESDDNEDPDYDNDHDDDDCSGNKSNEEGTKQGTDASEDENTNVSLPTERETTPSHRKNHLSGAYSDSVLEASLLNSVENLKYTELKGALKLRSLTTTGSKKVLKDRLFISLMDDAGYNQSGFAP